MGDGSDYEQSFHEEDASRDAGFVHAEEEDETDPESPEQHLVAGTDDEARLLALEKKVKARLALLDKLRATDLHTCAWKGQTDLVRAHVEVAAQNAAAAARKELRRAQKALQALQVEAATMKTGADDGEADDDEIAFACVALAAAVRNDTAATTKNWPRLATLSLRPKRMSRSSKPRLQRRRRILSTRPSALFAYPPGKRRRRQVRRRLQAAPLRGVCRFRRHRASAARVRRESARQDRRALHGSLPSVAARQLRRRPSASRCSPPGQNAAAQVLLEQDDKRVGWCDESNLVPAGDGRLLCPLDVARAVDRAPFRARTRGTLLGALKRRNVNVGGRPHKPSPPEVVRKYRLALILSNLAPQATDGDATGASMGGIEVLWESEHYATRDIATPNPPVQIVKVKVVAADDVKSDGVRAPAAALLVVHASAHRVRVPATETDVSMMGQLLPECVVLISTLMTLPLAGGATSQ